jgi:hypothetical protein
VPDIAISTDKKLLAALPRIAGQIRLVAGLHFFSGAFPFAGLAVAALGGYTHSLSYFRPSFFPATCRAIDSRMRFFRVSGHLPE